MRNSKPKQIGILCIFRGREEGEHDCGYYVASPSFEQEPYTTEDSITVGENKWKGRKPDPVEDPGSYVMVFSIYGKKKGLRARSARFATAKEIKAHEATSN